MNPTTIEIEADPRHVDLILKDLKLVGRCEELGLDRGEAAVWGYWESFELLRFL